MGPWAPDLDFGGVLGRLGPFCAPLEASWGASWVRFARLLGRLGASWARLGSFWGHLGDVLGRLGGVLGRLESILDRFWRCLGSS